MKEKIAREVFLSERSAKIRSINEHFHQTTTGGKDMFKSAFRR